MDTLVPIYSSSLNRYLYKHNGCNPDHSYTQFPIDSNEPTTPPPPPVDASPPSSEGDVSEKPDYFDAVHKFLNQMLMEEDDLQNKPYMLNECLALQVQAAEKSLYDVLVDNHPPSPNQHRPFAIDQNGYHSPSDYFTGTCSSEDSSSHQSTAIPHKFQSNLQPFGSLSIFDEPNDSFSSLSDGDQGKVAHFLQGNNYVNYSMKTEEEIFRVALEAGRNGRDHFPDGSRGKRSPKREDGDPKQEERSNKQLASYDEEPDQLELYDKVLLSDDINPHLQTESSLCSVREASQGSKKKGSKGRRSCSNGKEVVDLGSLLNQCAQALTNSNSSTTHEVLKKIRQHSSPYGDATERLAHYFANAIEARLAGTGAELYQAFGTARISAAQIIKAYHTYITACPFRKMSFIFANKSIKKISKGRKKLHIIDFGILYGFQWPCFIQGLSLRAGGPPKLRITGIDLPNPGFRPAERVEDTGHRLANYCKRFEVPFEYNAIAKKWEDIKIEDLKIEPDEVIVVNCIYRLLNVPDETVVESSPRDAVLGLIKRVKPDIFVHGVLNGTYNAPFSHTRFREALFHFSTMFDMFNTTVLREDKDRLLFEQQVLGRETMNVIACEGTSRIERPETYRQWQSRNVRAGFSQLPLYPEIVKEVRAKVKLNYHKDFLVDEDSNWMLQGWKGRVLHALSLWKPVE